MRDYFKNKGSFGPDGNYALRREWPAVGHTALYAGQVVRVLKVIKGECAADIAGDSLPEGTGRVGIGWLLQHNTEAQRAAEGGPTGAQS